MSSPRAARTGRTWLVYLLFFLSGAAGLIYEISWSRQIGLLFGNTVNAAAVVLGAYFCGMAAGYWHASRVAPRLRHPLTGYGVAELTVAAWALATPLLLHLLRHGPLPLLLSSDVLWQQTLVRAAVSLLVLLPATAALGATLPFVAQHLSPPQASQPQRIAVAYGFNTAGAVVGVLGATFVLILYAGVVCSSFIAAGISAVCGVVALVIRRHGAAPSVRAELVSARSDGKPATGPLTTAGGAKLSPSAGTQPLGPSTIYIFSALSGFGTLALQVLYIRLFALVFHNSTYTFGSIAGVFLIALALASWLFSALSRRFNATQIVAASALLGALTIPLSVLVMQRLTSLQYFDPPGGFVSYILGSLGLTSAVIFLPVLILGLMLPALWTAAGPAPSGNSVGRITALNTLAATAGSLLASFVLLPHVGLWLTFDALALLYAAAGLMLLARFDQRFAWTAVLVALLLAPQILAVGHLNSERQQLAAKLGYKFLYDSDSPYGAIDVIEKDGVRSMRQNRHYTLGTSAGVHSELAQGSLPLLLHNDPRRVCYLGLATGITAGAALQDTRVEQITAVELVPDVVKAADLFKDENGGIVHDPRAHIVVNDARHYLYASREQFDVIVSDLFVPWHSQTGYLYTLEHYTACKQRLSDGGLFCQWLPLYQLSARELEMICDTFATVFPVTHVYMDNESDGALLMLAGSTKPIEAADRAGLLKMQQRFGQKQSVDIAAREVAGLTSRQAAEMCLGRWPRRAQMPLNTDEHPRVEFLAPISQRENELLSGERLAEYKRRKLDHL